MGSRVTTTDINTSTTIDNRNAAGDNALLAVGGSTVTSNSGNTTTTNTTNTQHITNTSVDPESLRLLTASIPQITANNNKLAADAIAAQGRAAQDAIDAANRVTSALASAQQDALREVSRNSTMNLSESLSFAQTITDGNWDVVRDLGKIVSMQGSSQKEFAENLVGRVLEETRTGDERQTENFLKYMFYGVLAMAAAFALPQVYKAVR